MSRFINDDFKVKKGGRKAARISEDELKKKIIERAEKFGLDEEDDEEGYLISSLMTLQCEDEIIIKDMKYLVDCENIYINNDDYKNYTGTSYLGFHTLSNGLTFLGTLMGGDWEVLAIVIYYYDGKNIRCYVPSYGNTINLDFKTAFGSEGENYSIDLEKICEKYKKLKIINSKDKMLDVNGIDFYLTYFKKYGLDSSEVKINWDAIVSEIENRIEII